MAGRRTWKNKNMNGERSTGRGHDQEVEVGCEERGVKGGVPEEWNRNIHIRVSQPFAAATDRTHRPERGRF